MEYLSEKLNNNQEKAVKTTEGYVRVIAGPGSGKTMTIACRYAYMVNELGISPSNILCLTFTNKAAREMKDRIEKYIGKGKTGDFICTFHSFCLKFLREEIYRMNLAKNFTIMDNDDELSILKEIYPELKITATEKKYKASILEISEAKQNYPDYVYYFDDKEQKKPTYWSRVFSAFVTRQRKYNILSFDDLIYFTLHILNNHTGVIGKWSDRISYVMVDETQDNNKKQWAIANKLSEINKNLFVVGDPDQSIYGWRGAKTEFLIDFDIYHTPCTNIVLNDNYRSLKCILDTSNSLIKNNVNRIDKEMLSHRNEEEKKVIWHHASCSSDESSWICKKIESLKNNGDRFKDIAILYRNSYSSRNIEQSLIKSKIPYIVYGGIRFFERAEIKDILAYLRMIEENDDFSFLHIINTPKRGLGNAFVNKLKERALYDNRSLYDTLYDNLYSPEFDKKGARSFCKLINESRKMKELFSISDIMEYLIDESGIRQTLKENGDEERMENLKELVLSAKLYEEEHSDENISLSIYLQDIALYTNFDYKKDGDNISIMTIHQSKGLEFKNVFIYDLTDGILPSWRSIREGGILATEEERRIMYVAMTRAKDNLFLTDSLGYNQSFGTDKMPSRFIFETKKYCISDESIPFDKNQIKYDINYSSKIIEHEISQVFEKGSKVNHPMFGNGRILDVTEYGYYVIEFPNFGKRKINFNFKGLQLVEMIEYYSNIQNYKIIP